MREFGRHIWLLFICIALTGWTSGCNRTTADAPDKRPVIVATIFPLQSITSQLVGDWAHVELLLPPGSSPHDFELKPAQMEPLSRADVLVAVGLNIDRWAEKAAQQVGRKDLRVIRMAGSTPAELARSLARNPHLWMDPAVTMEFVATLGDALARQYPEHAAEIVQHAQLLKRQLSDLDASFRRRLEQVPNKEFVSYHNAYDPLAGRYGLNAVAHLNEIEQSPGGEVSPNDLVAAIEAIKKHHLSVIYAEPQYPPRATQAIREETGVRIMTLDDLGGPSLPGYDTYQAMLASNVETLAKGQSIQQ